MRSLLVVSFCDWSTGIVAGMGIPTFVADHGCVSSPPNEQQTELANKRTDVLYYNIMSTEAKHARKKAYIETIDIKLANLSLSILSSCFFRRVVPS